MRRLHPSSPKGGDFGAILVVSCVTRRSAEARKDREGEHHGSRVRWSVMISTPSVDSVAPVRLICGRSGESLPVIHEMRLERPKTSAPTTIRVLAFVVMALCSCAIEVPTKRKHGPLVLVRRRRPANARAAAQERGRRARPDRGFRSGRIRAVSFAPDAGRSLGKAIR